MLRFRLHRFRTFVLSSSESSLPLPWDCPAWDGVAKATLLVVFNENPDTRKPLVLSLSPNGQPIPSPNTFLGASNIDDNYQGRTDRGSALSIVAKDFVLTDGGTTAYAPDGDLISVSELVANENGQPTFFR